MESPYYAPPRMDGSRPSLGFPLGTALLLIVIFSLCGFFSCCYHWDKLQSLRRSFSADTDLEADNGDGSPSKPTTAYTTFKARPEPKLAGVDARRSDAKVHSAAVSLRAPTGGKDRPRAAEATKAAAAHSRAFVLSKKIDHFNVRAIACAFTEKFLGANSVNAMRYISLLSLVE
ncbi:unnamed protein product [Camellia sinensis]